MTGTVVVRAEYELIKPLSNLTIEGLQIQMAPRESELGPALESQDRPWGVSCQARPSHHLELRVKAMVADLGKRKRYQDRTLRRCRALVRLDKKG